jgi:hypothetical protein
MDERHSLEIIKKRRKVNEWTAFQKAFAVVVSNGGRESSTSNGSEGGFKSDNKGRPRHDSLWCLVTNHCGATDTDCLWLILMVAGWLVSNFRLNVDLTTPSDIYLRDTSSNAALGQETISRIICVAQTVHLTSIVGGRDALSDASVSAQTAVSPGRHEASQSMFDLIAVSKVVAEFESNDPMSNHGPLACQ